jgi:hypothetical protein
MSIILILGSLSACVPVTEAPPPASEAPEAIYTAAAKTMAFELTLSAGGTAVAQLTEVAQRPTATVELPTLLPILSETPTPPAPTLAPSTPTSIPLTCDTANFLGDVTIQPNTSFEPGERFLKIWRISNAGECTWTPDYSLVFTGGDNLAGPLVASLPGIVPPGESVDISMELIAPAVPGDYQGYWLLVGPASEMIEVVPNPLGALWVQIGVQGTLSSRGEFDFAVDYCEAEWRSDAGRLGCPGDSDDPDGSVILLDEPRLETRNEDEPALWLRPNNGDDEWISGEYPAFRVRDGDRFISEIGCLRDNPDCELRFDLDYRTDDGDVESLDSWFESYDGESTEIDIDLDDLEGETVQFILSVTNRGRTRDANGFWLVPHINNDAGESDLAISWRQEWGQRRLPDRVLPDWAPFCTGAPATCGAGTRDSGDARLSNAEV